MPPPMPPARLGGALKRAAWTPIYDNLTDLCMAHFHAVLDYPDEDIEAFRPGPLRREPSAVTPRPCTPCCTTYQQGRILAPGACRRRADGTAQRGQVQPAQTPWRALTGSSSPTSPAPPGTRWRSPVPGWAAPCCGSSTPPASGQAGDQAGGSWASSGPMRPPCRRTWRCSCATARRR